MVRGNKGGPPAVDAGVGSESGSLDGSASVKSVRLGVEGGYLSLRSEERLFVTVYGPTGYMCWA